VTQNGQDAGRDGVVPPSAANFFLGTVLIGYDGRLVEPWFKFFYVLLGATGAAFFTRDAPSSIPMLKALFPSMSNSGYARANLLLALIICVAVCYGIYDPQDQKQALISGFTSLATLKQLTRTRR
jgi:hypothetical protein